jgi:hypothetical protein
MGTTAKEFVSEFLALCYKHGFRISDGCCGDLPALWREEKTIVRLEAYTSSLVEQARKLDHEDTDNVDA